MVKSQRLQRWCTKLETISKKTLQFPQELRRKKIPLFLLPLSLLILCSTTLAVGHITSVLLDDSYRATMPIAANLESMLESAKGGPADPRPQQQSLTKSVREAAKEITDVLTTIDRLRTEGTLTEEEIKAQGFIIRPVTAFNLQKRVRPPSTTTETSNSGRLKSPVFNQEYNDYSQKQTSHNKIITQTGVKPQTSPIDPSIPVKAATPVNRPRRTLSNEDIEKTSIFNTNFNSSSSKNSSYLKQIANIAKITQPNKSSNQSQASRTLIETAKRLSAGMSRYQAKALLGKPSRESIVALPDTKKLAKLVVYKLQNLTPGNELAEGTSFYNNQKTEKLVLIFDQQDQLVSMEYDTDDSNS